MSKKPTLLRLTLAVDMDNSNETGLIRALLRYCNISSARTKPRWALKDILTDKGRLEGKLSERWSERQERTVTKALPAPTNHPTVPATFAEMNQNAAAANNQPRTAEVPIRTVQCIHRIFPPSACRICKPSTYTPYTPSNWEVDRDKREASELALLEARTKLARQQIMPMTGEKLMVEQGAGGIPAAGVQEDGVVYDFEMW